MNITINKRKFDFDSTSIISIATVIIIVSIVIIGASRFAYWQVTRDVERICNNKISSSLEMYTGETNTWNTFINKKSDHTFSCRQTGNFGTTNASFSASLDYIGKDQDYNFKHAVVSSQEFHNFENIILMSTDTMLIEKYPDTSGIYLLAVKDNIEIEISLGRNSFEQIEDDQAVISQMEQLIERLPLEDFNSVNNSFVNSLGLLTGQSRLMLKVENKTETSVTNLDYTYTTNESWK